MFLKIMQDWVGLLLMLFTFSIVLMWKRVRSDTKVVYAIWFCIFLHHAVALLNAYVCTVIGAEGDAEVFHRVGVTLAQYQEPTLAQTPLLARCPGLIVYTHFLAFSYRAFGPSLLFGAELSILAFVLSCVVLVKLVDLLDLRRFSVGIIFLFGLLPSAVIFRSVTLRESWQALFFLLTVYWAIRLQRRLSIINVLFLLMSIFCLALLHNALSYYVVYLFSISIYWWVRSRKKDVRWLRSGRFLFAGLFVVCVIIFTQKMESFMTIGQGLGEAKQFRQAAMDTIASRTDYGIQLDTSSVFNLVKTIPMIFVQYMLAPFPWKVENMADICAMLESMLRIVLLFFALSSWRRSSGEVRSYYSFLLIAVLSMEFMWAMGTINWGSGIRHHVPGYSVIVLLGTPGLILFMRKLHFGMFGCRKVSRLQDREEFIRNGSNNK